LIVQQHPERPSAVLRAEHQTILRVVRILGSLMDRYERTGDFPDESLARCVEFFRLFADACHHAKEEGMLFPVLEMRGIPREGGPIGVMLYEHQVARGLTRDMGEALAAAQGRESGAHQKFLRAARQYHDLLTQHIFKEDNVLFHMGDRVMTADDQATLANEFCQSGCRMLEGRRHEELEKIADDLEAQWASA
jgi:hemerythrin-like domain-containing protein